MSLTPTDRPTDQEGPTTYLSLRVTIPHTMKDRLVEKVLYDMPWYIGYPHKGRGGQNEHFHVFFGDDGPRYRDRIRKRVKDHFGDGNRNFCLKLGENGIAQAIQYGSKEGTIPFVFGDFVGEWIDNAPEWEHRNLGQINTNLGKRPLRNVDHFYQITYSNMEKVTLRYRLQNGLKTTDLAEVLEHMHANGWRLQISVERGGIPHTMFEQFAAACNNGTVYCSGRFNRMKVDSQWHRH